MLKNSAMCLLQESSLRLGCGQEDRVFKVLRVEIQIQAE
jgi:hypothetical protein